jgi:transposase-like protein
MEVSEQFKLLLKEQLKQQSSAGGISDLLQQVFKEAIQEMLQAEMDNHVGYEKHSPDACQYSNSRNGTGLKTIKTKLGNITIEVPRDRESSFEPQVVPKRKRVMEEIEDHVLLLYSHGMSTRDIESAIKDIYGVAVSEAHISHITDRIIEHIDQWKKRPLEKVYLVVWMDAIVFKVRQDGRVQNKAMQIAVGLNNRGYKQVLGMWLCSNESAAFWVNVLSDIKRRGVEDILISSTDNLRGFTDAISTLYPKAKTQICVVHQLRNSLKFVMWKDKKAVVAELKKIYNASDEATALHYLESFDSIWSKKYPFIAKSWRANWQNLSTFYEFPECIRKIIYTTNIIENINMIIRKYTKTKCSLPNDQAVEKVVYLALMQIARKWSQPQDAWASMLVNFIDIFGQERCDVEV